MSFGADMVAKDNNNDSALHHAAANLNYLATKVLSEAGAPLEEKNKEVWEGRESFQLKQEPVYTCHENCV